MPGTDPAALPATPWKHRARRSLSPAALARSVLLTVLALLAAPLAAGAALLALGLLAGQSLLTSPGGALVQVSTITVILFGTATLTLIFAMLAVAFVHTGSYAGQPALLRWAAAAALGALPRLLAALVVAAAVLLVTLVGWYAVTGALLVVAVVLEVRHLRTPAVGDRARTSPGVRRALLWAIPFLPVLAALALLVALFPAALSRPTSVKHLMALAAVRVRTQKPALAGLALVVGGGSALLSWGGMALSTHVQGGATDAGTWAFVGGTAVLGVAVLLMVVFAGTALAVLRPAQPPAGPGTAPAARAGSRVGGLLRLASPLMRRTAIVVVLTLAATLLVPPAPALAEAATDDTSTVDAAAVDAPLADELSADALPFEAPADDVAPIADTAEAGDPSAAAEAPLPAESETAEPEAASPPPAASQRIAAALAVGAPTTVTADLAQGGSLGETLVVNITISDPADPSVTDFAGTVDAYAGTTLLVSTSTENLQWGLYVPTGAMEAGDTDLRIVYVPAAGAVYAASETILPVQLSKAYTSFRVSAVPAAGSGPLVWGESHVVTAEIGSSLDGDFDLQVINTSEYPQTVITTVPVSILDGVAEVSIDLTGLFEPGQVYYMLKVVENDRYGPGGTEAPGQEITAAPTTLSLSGNQRVTIGQTVTLFMEIGTGSIVGRTTDGLIDVTASGYRLDPVRNNKGIAAVTFTPIRLGTIDISATYRGDTVFMSATAQPMSIEVVTAYASTPTFRWYGDLTRDDAHVEIIFAASRGLDKPTGLIEIVDQGNKVVGQATLVDGVFDAPVKLREGTSTYRALYHGDQWYQPYTVYLPDQTVEPYVPVVTLTTSDAAPLEGDPFTLTVSVTDVPRALIKSVTLLEEGSQTRTFTLNDFGTGSLSITRTWAMLNTFSVLVEYMPEAYMPNTVSAPVLVDVQDALIPDLRLTTTTPPDRLRAGSALDLVVTVGTPTGLTSGLTAGSVVWVADTQVVLQAGANGLTGTVRTTAPKQGGPFTVQAGATYGPNNKLVQSQPLALIALAPETTLSITGVNSEIGSFNTIKLAAAPPEGYSVTASAIDVEVQTVVTDPTGAVLSIDTKAVRMYRSGTDSRFTGSTLLHLLHAGNYRMTIRAAGDGVSVGAGAGAADWTVMPGETVVTVQMHGYAPWGSDHVVGSHVAARNSGGQLARLAPTGSVTYTATRTGASCTAILGATCTIPEAKLATGDNPIQARYSGDADNAPSTGTATVVTAAQTVQVTAAISPTPDTWMDGQTVTASWNVARLGRAAKGYVTATIGAASCVGYALVGSCELTVPPSVRQYGPAGLAYAVYFTSTDGEDVRGGYFGSASPQACVVPEYFSSTLELISGTPCDHQGTAGFITGSVVEITAGAVPDRHVYGQWSVNGLARDIVRVRDDGTARFRVSLWNHSNIRYSTRYQPTCFTLTVGPVVIDEFHPGQLKPITSPNCSDPDTPTKAELRALDAGTAQYAAGTVVTMRAMYASIDTMWSHGKVVPGLTLTGFTGATALAGNPDIATVLMDQDRAVTADFKVSKCSSVGLHRSEGGSITIESATRPDNSASLAPVSGECIDGRGQAGYVPGTRLTLRASADAGAVLESVTSVVADVTDKCSTGIDCGRDVGIYDIHLVRTLPYDSQSKTRKVVVGGPTIYGATFALVRCVRVDTVVRSLASIVDDKKKPVTDLHMSLASTGTESGCGGRQTTTTEVKSGPNLQRTTSTWYIKKGTVAASVARPTLTHLPEFTSTVRWSHDAGVAMRSDSVAWTGTGPSVNLAQMTEDVVTVKANWIVDDCRVPVQNRQGGPIDVEVREDGVAVPADDLLCPQGLLAPTDQGILHARPMPGSPELVPFFSVASDWPIPGHLDSRLKEAPDGRWYAQDWLYVPDAQMLQWQGARLEYCAPLRITAGYIGDNGWADTMKSETVFNVVSDNGGCPPNYALPGKTVSLSLTSFGDYWYTVSPKNTPLPVIVIDENGNHDPRDVELTFGARCQTVTVGHKVAITTEANCPGTRADNRFVRGTAVEVEAALGGKEEFRSWAGVQTSKNTTAWVLASEDRSVTLDYHTVGPLEFAGRLLSSLGQRLLGYLVTAGTGILMAEVLLVQGVALAVRGAAAGLSALGVNGYVLNSILYGLDNIEAQLEMMSALASCLSTWSTGSETPITDIPVDPTLARGINMTSDKITEKLQDALEKQLQQRGYETAGGMIGVVGQGRALADAFLTNLDSYNRSASQGWSNMTGEVGSCMTQRAKSAGWLR